MPASSIHLNPWNPAHWLLLIYWFVATPDRLRQYRAGLDAEGEAALRMTTRWSVIILTALPLPALIGYIWLHAQSFGPGRDWHYYLPSLALLASMLVAVVVALIYGKPDLVWVTGLAMMLMVALPLSVGYLANLFTVYVVFHMEESFGNDGAMRYILPIVISLALCGIAALLAGVSAALSRIVQLRLADVAKERTPSRWSAGLQVGLGVGLVYGVVAGLIVDPGGGLNILSYNYDIVNVELPAMEVMLALVAVLTCLRLYQRGSNAVAVGVAVAIMLAIIVASVVATTLAFARTQGLLHGTYEGMLLSVVGFLNISLMTLIAATGYGLLYGLAFLLASSVADALTRRYRGGETMAMDKAGSPLA